MIATAFHDGDGGESYASQARLQTSSKTRRFDPRSSLSPISGIWSPAPHLLVRQTLYQAPSVGYVMGSRKGDGIGFERPSSVFKRDKLVKRGSRRREASGTVNVQGWYAKERQSEGIAQHAFNMTPQNP